VLEEQARQLSGTGRYWADVLVVDNDPDAGAAEAMRRVHAGARYVHEPAPGLAAVRNRALEVAAESRLLLFMDDDGRPAPGWLVGMVDVWEATGRPDAVAGRVLEHYESTPSAWIVAGGFFRRRSLRTGAEVSAAPAGNLLLDVQSLRARGLRFDDRFGFSGGEDTLLTRQLVRAGGRIVWCEEAAVVDQVPTDRMSRDWVLRRARSHGSTSVAVSLVMTESVVGRAWVRLVSVLGGVARVAAGGARATLGTVAHSDRHQARGWRLVHRGLGMLSAGVGRVMQEYRP
jgi:succinoglycan biosynthesis protein ExoM